MIAFGPFRLRSDDRLLRDGKSVALPPKETALLRLLCDAEGRVVSKGEILDRIWDEVSVSETSLTRCIHSLRSLLADAGRRGGVIETVHGRGYRIALPVQHMQEAPPTGWLRVAVVPFDTEGQAKHEYLAQGLAADVTDQLGQLHEEGLVPLARQSAQRLQEAGSDALALARDLNLDFMVSGRLRVGTRMLDLWVELIRVSDQLLVWSQQFSCPEGAAARLAGEITEVLAKRLGRHAAAPPTPISDETEDPRAYRALLQGDFASQLRTERGLRRAIDCYRRAIEWDPHFATAHAALARASLLLGVRGYAAPHEVVPSARASLERALDLDGHNVVALGTLAHLHWAIDWRPHSALRLITRAERIAPEDDFLLWRRGQILTALGRFEEALEAYRHSLRRNPFSPNTLLSHAQAHYFAGQSEDALAVSRLLVDAEPEFAAAHALRALTAAELGHHDEAIAAAAAADVTARTDQLARCSAAYARAVLGQEREARAALAMLERTAGRRYVSGTFVAVIHLGLGELEAALAALERAVADRCMWLPFVATDPRFALLRDVPRFREIAMRVTGRPLDTDDTATQRSSRSSSKANGRRPVPVETFGIGGDRGAPSSDAPWLGRGS